MLRPGPLIVMLWVVFWISWLVAAGWSAKTERRVGMKGELAYRLVLIVGTLAFLPPAHGYYGPMRLWLVSRDQAWAFTAVLALGLAFTWLARIHLGTLWICCFMRYADHR